VFLLDARNELCNRHPFLDLGYSCEDTIVAFDWEVNALAGDVNHSGSIGTKSGREAPWLRCHRKWGAE
jgi:hypothetical protein